MEKKAISAGHMMNEPFNKSLMKFTLRVSAGILKLRFTFYTKIPFSSPPLHRPSSPPADSDHAVSQAPSLFSTNVPFFFCENIFLYFRFAEEELHIFLRYMYTRCGEGVYCVDGLFQV